MNGMSRRLARMRAASSCWASCRGVRGRGGVEGAEGGEVGADGIADTEEVLLPDVLGGATGGFEGGVVGRRVPVAGREAAVLAVVGLGVRAGFVFRAGAVVAGPEVPVPDGARLPADEPCGEVFVFVAIRASDHLVPFRPAAFVRGFKRGLSLLRACAHYGLVRAKRDDFGPFSGCVAAWVSVFIVVAFQGVFRGVQEGFGALLLDDFEQFGVGQLV